MEEIPPGNSHVIGVAEHVNYRLGCQCRALRSSVEQRLGVVLLPGPPAVRHAVWIMTRCGIGREPRFLNVTKEGLTGHMLLRPMLLRSIVT